MTSSKPPIPRLPGGPDPAQPVPRTPVDGLDLQAYAAVAARLAAAEEPRAAVLASARLDERRWLAIEQTWLLRLATSLLQQDRSLAEEHDAALRAAQEAIVAGRLPTLEVYAAVVARILSGRDPAAALAEAGLSPAAFACAQRTFGARIAEDPAFAARFRALLERPDEG
ncbi:hypothetical protein [Sorangium cellulosum]|uniref:hypothetical protein n=1 Tax=Sorangium cellulosum TaxID=56 RepID=UPI0012DB1441|nr:hypothetical protein [Sorangium cellulosum]